MLKEFMIQARNEETGEELTFPHLAADIFAAAENMRTASEKYSGWYIADFTITSIQEIIAAD